MNNDLTAEQVKEKLANASSEHLMKHRMRCVRKYGVTGKQIDAELHRRVAELVVKTK